jgi:lysophospholipase L1-like esterase
VGGNPTLINGVTVPLADKYVLTPTEQTEVKGRIDAFNTIIAAAVNAKPDRLLLIDVHTILLNLKAKGASIGGSALSASISPPFGGFSLDGIHPNARGNGYLANQFIEAINAKFQASIPLCNPNDFSGNALPVP